MATIAATADDSIKAFKHAQVNFKHEQQPFPPWDENRDNSYYNYNISWPYNVTWDNQTDGESPLLSLSDGSSDRNYWSLVLLAFPLLTVFGNVLVVLSVYRERSLQTVTNYFIVSLAIADIMVATFVMPLSVYVEV